MPKNYCGVLLNILLILIRFAKYYSFLFHNNVRINACKILFIIFTDRLDYTFLSKSNILKESPHKFVTNAS